MRVELYVPLGIAKEGVQFAQCRVNPLVTPCEVPILEMNLLQFTRVKGGAEAVDAACINISLVLVSCMVDLIEIARGKPHDPTRKLLSNELGKESIFSRGSSGPIDGSDLEVNLRVPYVNHGREAMSGSGNIIDFNQLVIPELEDPSSSSICRALSKTTEPIPPKICSNELINIVKLHLL